MIHYRTLQAAAILSLLAACLSLGLDAQASTRTATAVRTMRQDQDTRSPDIHWPAGFDPATADLFSHNALLIRAPCAKVFGLIEDASRWPSWYPNSSKVRIVDGGPQLGPDTRFRWTTFDLDIESKVHEFVPDSRIGWYGYTSGQAPAFYHTWYLTPAADGCMTVMEEVGKGAAPAHLRDTDEGLMHRGHDLWLETLRWEAESQGT
ncbi:SRPBCC family protein [Lichenihabitans sp. PAMC28606]|uniref:SRPBCC family protein n=1 Tax=Lichenihabitans sp. PAMC28606 TaxID=2880932 RepID=UPI001D0BBB71|nr:SRPBCC family protein [Lichenihabitans sp. PAMC28606]UDL94073.1 SRPBCC family protein [Lichenihabitans sp. PAMC28606]